MLGEASEFDLEYGYYVQGVTSKTPMYARAGWLDGPSRADPRREVHRLVHGGP
jgi:hypothetical protein